MSSFYLKVLQITTQMHKYKQNKKIIRKNNQEEKIEEVQWMIFLAKKIQLVSWHKILQRKLITNLSGTRKLTKNIF